MKYTCPSCGWAELSRKPFERMPVNICETRGQPIPYETIWGWPSYEVCGCCGFEFGNDDNPGTAPGNSFESYLKDWITEEQCRWLDPKSKPDDWSLEAQLAKAGIVKPT